MMALSRFLFSANTVLTLIRFPENKLKHLWIACFAFSQSHPNVLLTGYFLVKLSLSLILYIPQLPLDIEIISESPLSQHSSGVEIPNLPLTLLSLQIKSKNPEWWAYIVEKI